MTLEKFAEYEKQMAEALGKYHLELEKYDNLIKEAGKKAVEIEPRIEKAERAGEIDDYTKAIKDKQAAIFAEQNLKYKRETFERQPIMTPGEYDKIKQDILTDMENVYTEAEKKIKDLIAQTYEICEEVVSQNEYANKVLRRLQVDIAKRPPVAYLSNGNTVEQENLKWKFEKRNGIVNTVFYRLNTFEKIKQIMAEAEERRKKV
ncbi:MAG: hypothetical protein GX222_02115 [Ruminococcaceae bacterium]|nr:hypothetical protein [Oscillospiraceae bacterium]